MLGIIVFAIALVGSGIAAVWDLRTTEVPDIISLLTAGSGILVHLILTITTGELTYIVSSLVVGSLFFGLGWIFFLTGIWGGADAFVMGAVGFALPTVPQGFQPAFSAPWPFGFTLLINIFIVGAVYTMFFALYKGLGSKKVMEEFFNDIKGYWKRMVLISAFYVVLLTVSTIVTVGFSGIGTSTRYFLGTLPILLGFLAVYRFLKNVEKYGMTSRISVDDLEEGDVLAKPVELEDEVLDADRIVGVTEDQVSKIRDAVDEVTVKSGVMFVPSFPVAILLSVFLGDLIVLFFI